MLDLSFRHYRAGAAPRNWHRKEELLHPGNPERVLDEKAARKIAKYKEASKISMPQLTVAST